jgi:hypothetical protein
MADPAGNVNLQRVARTHWSLKSPIRHDCPSFDFPLSSFFLPEPRVPRPVFFFGRQGLRLEVRGRKLRSGAVLSAVRFRRWGHRRYRATRTGCSAGLQPGMCRPKGRRYWRVPQFPIDRIGGTKYVGRSSNVWHRARRREPRVGQTRKLDDFSNSRSRFIHDPHSGSTKE